MSVMPYVSSDEFHPSEESQIHSDNDSNFNFNTITVD